MINVVVGTNTGRDTIIVADTMTPKDIFAKQGIDYARANVHLDGAALSAAGMNTSLKDHKITEKCTLIAVVKGDNA